MRLDIHAHARDDLRRLARVDPKAVAVILAIFQQIEADPRAIDKLTTRGEVRLAEASLNVKRWERARELGSLWRLRILNTPATAYRIVYGYHWQTRRICVLGIIQRGLLDYDDLNSQFPRRLLVDWHDL